MPHKQKIIERLRAKFQGVNLSTARVEAIASKLDAKITEEDQIDGKLDELNEIFPFADMAKEDDRLRTLEAKAKEKEEESKKNSEEDNKIKTSEDKKTDDPVLALLQEMKGEIAALKSDKVVTSRKSVAVEKFKDAPEAFKNDLLEDLNMISFTDDNHFNTYIERKEKAFADFKQAQSEAGLGNDKPSRGAGGTSSKEATKAELDKVMENLPI